MYRVRIDVNGPAGVLSDRLIVATSRQLGLNRAEVAANSRLQYIVSDTLIERIGPCRRYSQSRVDCRRVWTDQVQLENDQCRGRVSVTLARDGLHYRYLRGYKLPTRPRD